MDKPLVSVIIPKCSHEDISDILMALNRSTYKNIETIIVDEGLERSAQRNIGIKRAKGEYLLILDADQVPSINLIHECVFKMYTLPLLEGIFIPEIIRGDTLFDNIRNHERRFYTGTAVDVVRFVRRKDCPLFDETMSGPEDSDWDRRIKGGRDTSNYPLYHCDNMDLKKYIQKKAYYTKSMKRYQELHPDDKLLKLWYRCFWIFVEDGKWKMLLKHPILSLGIVFIIFIRGVLWVRR